jgi:tetratricopeptide (TPR) repeat protein
VELEATIADEDGRVGSKGISESLADLRRRGERHAVRGELGRALECFDAARGIAVHTGDEALLSNLLGQIGEAVVEQGDIDRALGFLREARDLEQARQDKPALVVAHRRLAWALREKGDHAGAESALRDAERLLDSTEASEQTEAERVRIAVERSALYADQAQYVKAQDLLRGALEVAERRGDEAQTASCLRRLGAVLHQSGDFEQALTCVDRALKILEAQDKEERDNPEVIEVKLLRGAVLEDEGQTGNALDCYREALKLAEDLRLAPSRAECLRRMGSAYRTRGDFPQAIDRYGQAIDICRRLEDEVALSLLLGDLGDVYAEQGHFDEAIKQFRNALDLDLRHQDKLGMAVANRRLGAAFQQKGDYDRAEDAYRESERLLDDSDDDGEKAVLHNHVGSLQQERGHYRHALESYEKACAINEAQRNWLGVAVSLRHIASAKQERGLLNEAEADLERALGLLQQQGGEDKPELIEATNLLGSVLQSQGRINDALKHYRNALLLAESLNLPPARAESLRRLASAHATNGEYPHAAERYRQAIDICRDIADQVALSGLHGELGDVFAEQGNVDDAITEFKEAQRLDQSQEDDLGMAVTYRRLGAAYQCQGKHDSADEAYRDARRLLENLDDEEEKALLYLNWGSLYEDQGQYRLALDAYGQAHALDAMGLNPMRFASCLRQLGSASLRLGETKTAESYLTRAMGALSEHGGECRPELIAARELEAKLRIAQDRIAEARDAAEEALRGAEDIQHLPAQCKCLRTLGTVLTAEGKFSRAIDRFSQALDIARNLRDEVMRAELLDDLADAYLHEDDLQKAIEAYNGGLKRARRLDRHALTVDILLGLARAYRRQGKADIVRDLLDEASEVMEHYDVSRLTRAELTLELGHMAEQEGRYDEAIDSFERALEDFVIARNAELELECHRLLLSVYVRKHQLAEAAVHLGELLGQENPGRLWESTVLRRYNPAIASAARPGVNSGRFGLAVTEAFKAFEVEIRNLEEAPPADGLTKVIGRWFSDGEGRRGIRPFIDAEELLKFRGFVEASIDAARNRHAHQQIDMDATEAFAWLGVAHLLMEYLKAPSEELGAA